MISTCSATLIDNCVVSGGNQLYLVRQTTPFTYVHRSLADEHISILTGDRDIEIEQTTSDPLRPASYGFSRASGPDSAILLSWEGHTRGNGFGQRGFMRLQYDVLGDEIDNLGFGKTLRYSGQGVPLLESSVQGIRLKTQDDGSSQDIFGSVIMSREGSELARVRTLLNPEFGEYIHFPFDTTVLSQTDCITIEVETFAESDRYYGLFIYQVDTIVPEPGTAVALAAGAGALAVGSRKRRKQSR